MSLLDGVGARRDNFTTGKTAVSWYPSVSSVGVNLATLLFDAVPLLSPSPALIWNHTPGMAAHTDPLLVHLVYLQCSWRRAGWQEEDICHRWEIATPSALEKTPRNNEIWYCYIKVVEKAVFQWCYLSCSVLTPCNDDLSLFSVMCSIFIYDQASFSLYYFGFITHSFVPYLQLMKK